MLYLHIGTHKTGTSTIQQSLRDSYEVLKSDGVGYLNLSYNIIKAREVMRAAEFDSNLVDKLSKEISQAHAKVGDLPKLVLSNEAFSGEPYNGYLNSKVVAEILRAAIKVEEVKVVVYLRTQDQFVESLYTQSIHEGGSKNFTDFLGNFSDHEAFDYHRLVSDFQEVFGVDQVIVRSYCDESNKGLLKGFSNLIGSEHLAKWAGGDRNLAYSRNALEIARICNLDLDQYSKQKLRSALQIVLAKKRGESFSYFDDRSRVEFLGRFRDSNSKIGVEHGTQGGKDFFPNFVASPELETESPDSISYDDAASLILKLFEIGAGKKPNRLKTTFMNSAIRLVKRVGPLERVARKIYK